MKPADFLAAHGATLLVGGLVVVGVVVVIVALIT